MIILKYNVDTCGPKLEARTLGVSVIFQDSACTSLFESDAMTELKRLGVGVGHEIHIPETPETLALFDKVRALVEAHPNTHSHIREDSWTLDSGIEFVRLHQERVMEAGWCLMLGGGVLNRGFGPDLDLIAYPRTLSSVVSDFVDELPGGKWSSVGVANIYTIHHEDKPIEIIFQTHIPEKI